MQVGVSERVVTELEPGVEPHLQERNPASIRRPVAVMAESVEAIFVDEADHGDVPGRDLGQQPSCQSRACRGIHLSHGNHG